jgi:membrane associated rhomboid family serine protease
LGAYLVLFPLAQVRTLVRLGFIVVLPRIPAVVLLGLWFLLQLGSSIASLHATTETGGVAYAAHVGGFIFGVVTARLFEGRQPLRELPQSI